MDFWTNIYRRLDRVQEMLWFRIAASVLVLVVGIGAFGMLLAKSYSLDAQRKTLVAALTNQNVTRADEHAVSFKTSGEVFVNNRRYGGEQFVRDKDQWFDADGNLLAAPYLAERLIADQRPSWAPDWLLNDPATTWLLAAVFLAWALLIVWMGIALPFVLTAMGTAALVGLFWLGGMPKMMLACAGVGLLTFTFVLLTRAVQALINRPIQTLAVAHTVMKEASRTGLPLVFIVLLLISLPIIPMMADEASPLRYRMQTFLARSMGWTFFLAAVMTLFLSCASIAFEIRDRQIWQLVTKPLWRINYLAGKWLGVMLINLVLLSVSAVSIFTYVQYLKQQPVAAGQAGTVDLMAVKDEILTARIGTRPAYDQLNAEQLRERVDKWIEEDPTLSVMEKVPAHVRLQRQRYYQQEHSAKQRMIAPGPDGARIFKFEGLQAAKADGSPLTLKYRFHILRDSEHETFKAAFVFLNEDEQPLGQQPSTYVPTVTHSFQVPSQFIGEDGILRVGLVNMHQLTPEQRAGGGQVGSLNFEEADFEVLHKVGNFEGNFFRAVLVSWVKLAFLAALGIGTATFLSFPVACLLSFTIFLSGMLGPYLAESLEYWYDPELKELDFSKPGLVIQWVFWWVTRHVADLLVFLLGAFGEYKPSQNLVEGRLIPWATVVSAVLRLGVLWSLLAMVVGWLVMRRRQLAIYSGQG